MRKIALISCNIVCVLLMSTILLFHGEVEASSLRVFYSEGSGGEGSYVTNRLEQAHPEIDIDYCSPGNIATYLPSTADGLLQKYDTIMLSDIPYSKLTSQQVQAIVTYVQSGGGLVMVGGTDINPSSYKGTPIETTLPATFSGSYVWKTISVQVVNPNHQILSGLNMSTIPTLGGYDVVYPKSGAELVLKGSDNAPLLICWSYGNGRSVVFSSDITYAWGEQLKKWAHYADFIANILKWSAEMVSSTGSIAGMKYEDKNNNGVKDDGEPGLSGWTIELFGDRIYRQTVTGSDGGYSFSGLPSGTYTVSEVQQQDWTQTAPASGTHSINLETGQNVVGKDFGNYKECTEWTFVIVTDLHIGRNYLDYDGQGYFDVGIGEDYYLTERLKKTVNWVNDNHMSKKIKFVAVLGDIAENGQFSEMKKAKEILDGLDIPYFPVIGNHDVWSRYNYVKNSRTGEIKRSDPVAEGEGYFKDVFFDKEFFRQQCVKLGVTQWDFDGDIQFYNYAFVYEGVKFIGLDFVSRIAHYPPGGVVHKSSEEWLQKHLYINNTQAVLLSHHPVFKNDLKGCADVSAIEATLIRAATDFRTEVLADFAGHIHGTYDEYQPYWPIYYVNEEINKDWSLDEPTPAGIPVVTTEGLMAASNLEEPKGCLRLVKINNNRDIDFHLVYGGYDFRALNPYFTTIRWRPARFKLGWDVQFELLAFNKIYEAYFPIGKNLQEYSLYFGDGSEANWYDVPSIQKWCPHRYPPSGGSYTAAFTLSKDDINVSESVTRAFTLPRLKLAVAAYSPVDIILTDPDGLTTTKQVYGIPESYYYEEDFDEDGDPDDVVALSDLKVGDYLIIVQPHPEANLIETYTIEVLGEDTTVSLAYDVQVAHIPPQSYILKVTEAGIIPVVPATVDFDPNTLNLKGQRKYVTTYIELPAGHGYDPNMINLGTITLNGQIQAEAKPVELGDYDADGIPDLMVKFNRSEVQKILQVGEEVKITISGNLTDGTLFAGIDFICVRA